MGGSDRPRARRSHLVVSLLACGDSLDTSLALRTSYLCAVFLPSHDLSCANCTIKKRFPDQTCWGESVVKKVTGTDNNSYSCRQTKKAQNSLPGDFETAVKGGVHFRKGVNKTLQPNVLPRSKSPQLFR